MTSRRILSHELRHAAIKASGGKCEFPDCGECDPVSLQIAHIHAASAHGPRYSPRLNGAKIYSLDNIIVLCANHHLLADSHPERYSVQFLIDARAASRSGSVTSARPAATALHLQNTGKVADLSKLHQYWVENGSDHVEENWQNFFHANPIALTATVNSRFISYIGQKCYVGGKRYTNIGGGIADFLTGSKTGSVSIVEIKTPCARLLGRRYRENSYSISEELTGAISQVLSYRRRIIQECALKNYDLPSEAYDVPCVVIAGNSAELDNDTKRASYNMFKGCLSNVFVMTYDEVFDKIAALLD